MDHLSLYHKKNPFSIRKYYFSSNHEMYLTAREVSCLAQVALGLTVKEIAQTLGISYRTVESHMNNIKNKLGCNHFIEAVNLAREHHIL